MKTPRLSRSRTSADGTPSSSKSRSHGPSPIGPEQTFRTSFDDLRRPENRQMLRRHLTGQFPESRLRASDESLHDRDAKERQRLSRSQSSVLAPQSEFARSSRSSLTSDSLHRLSPVRETRATIDFEQAIDLLQELKKSASPDQLVALHKALLPTRDSTISLASSLPVNEDVFSQPPLPPIRHRSLQPAGLATRGGPMNDLLRRQTDPDQLKQFAVDDWGRPRSPTPSKSTIAALDLAADNDPTTGIPMVRPLTPTDADYEHTGIYRRGTLRITNGAASPDPSVILRVDPQPSEPIAGEEIISESRESTPKGDNSGDDFFSARGSFDIDSPADLRLPLQGHLQEDEVVIDDTPIVVDETPVVMEPASVEEDKARQSHLALRQSLMNARNSRDVSATAISPVASDLPRFAQRWSHRGQHISQEYITDGGESPFGEVGRSSLGPRPQSSSNRRESWKPSTAGDTPAAALRQLNANMEVNDGDAPSGSNSALPTASKTENTSRFGETHKLDSGYASEASVHGPQHPRISVVVSQIDRLNKPLPRYPSTYDPAAELSIDPEAKSLYTVHDILKRPSLLDGFMRADSSPAVFTEKKSKPLLSLGTSRRSAPTSPSVSTPDASVARSAGASPTDVKKHRKLQKQIPETLRLKRRAEKKALKSDRQGGSVDLPSVPNELVRSFAKRPNSVMSGTDLPIPVLAELEAQGSGQQNAMNDRRSPDLSALPSLPPPSPHLYPTPNQSAKRPEDPNGRPFSLIRKASFTGKATNHVRRRSKSAPRPTNNHSKSRSVDFRQMSCTSDDANHASTSNSKPADDDYAPPFTDIGTTARALGSSPYDVSTKQFKRRVAVPGAVQHHIQSPHQIGQVRTKGSGMVGMEDNTASELARLKSRDLAIANNEPVFDRPRFATPRGPRSQRPKSAWTRSASSTDAVPTLAANPPNKLLSSVRSRALGEERPQSMYTESIPSMPDVPAEYQQQPGGTVRGSLPPPITTVNGSDSNEAIADVIRRTVSQRKAHEPRHRPQSRKVQLHQAKTVVLQKVQAPMMSLPGGLIDLAGSTTGSLLEEEDDDAEENEAAAAAVEATDGAPGWAEHAHRWRERRMSIERRQHEPTPSPSIIVSQHPPSASEEDTPAVVPTEPDAANLHAATYAALIGSGADNPRPAKDDVPRTDSAKTFATAFSQPMLNDDDGGAFPGAEEFMALEASAAVAA